MDGLSSCADVAWTCKSCVEVIDEFASDGALDEAIGERYAAWKGRVSALYDEVRRLTREAAVIGGEIEGYVHATEQSAASADAEHEES